MMTTEQTVILALGTWCLGMGLDNWVRENVDLVTGRILVVQWTAISLFAAVGTTVIWNATSNPVVAVLCSLAAVLVGRKLTILVTSAVRRAMGRRAARRLENS